MDNRWTSRARASCGKETKKEQSNATALIPWATPSTNARIPRVQGTAPPWATPRVTAFVFAPKKPCNRPQIDVVWSAWSDQLLNSRDGSRRGILRTACTTLQHSHQETQGSADSVFAVCDGFGVVPAQAARVPTPRAPCGDARDQRRPGPASRRQLLPPPSRTRLPQGPHTVPGRHHRPYVLVQPADVVLPAVVPPGSASRETHGTGEAPFRRPPPNQAPASPPRYPPRPRLAEERPRDRRRPGGGPRPPQGARKPCARLRW